MKTVTDKVYLLAIPASYEECGYRFDIFSCEIEEYITVGSQEITMEIPEDFDINTAHIDILKAEKSKIQAEAHLKAQNLEDQIQALLCIEHQEN